QATGAAKFVAVSTPKMTWPQAQTYCRTYYTDLASSLTSTDNNLLGQIRSAQGDSWIGLYRDNWVWSDGTVSGYLWAPGQIPSTYNSNNCAMAYNGQFNQETCTNLHYFFCYT
ncbi:macrophage mannose receptor 1-like isoform X6, partial [Clarias magur]